MTDVGCKPAAEKTCWSIAEPLLSYRVCLKGSGSGPGSLSELQTLERSKGEVIYLRDLQLSHCGITFFFF